MINASLFKKSKKITFNIIEDSASFETSIPQFFLLINPENLKISYNKRITRSETIGGFYEEHWGDELDKITCDLSTGAFMHQDHGLTTVFQKDTDAYKNFDSFVQIYRHNGNTFDTKGRIINKGYIIMNYDGDTYLGHFESLNYKESADTPFRFIFDFSFIVEKSYLNY